MNEILFRIFPRNMRVRPVLIKVEPTFQFATIDEQKEQAHREREHFAYLCDCERRMWSLGGRQSRRATVFAGRRWVDEADEICRSRRKESNTSQHDAASIEGRGWRKEWADEGEKARPKSTPTRTSSSTTSSAEIVRLGRSWFGFLTENRSLFEDTIIYYIIKLTIQPPSLKAWVGV